MAAPKGNSFYLLRSKDGRDKKYTTAISLLDACYNYFKECDNNPWYKNEVIKSGEMVGTIIRVPTSRPYTERGLFLFIGISRTTWDNYKADKDFLAITTHAEEIIYTQKFEGAAVGAFNANIIARDLGLKDNQDITTNGESINDRDINRLTPDEQLNLLRLHQKMRDGA